MKKVLWIACLLCMIPFLGIAQNRAGLATQDESAGFGQAPVSKELPATFQLKNGLRSGDTLAHFHTMFVPPQNFNYGRYYEIALVGSTAYVKQVKMYNDWYYSAADYYYNAEEQTTAPEYPVWAYANDYTEGFMTLNFKTGAYIKNSGNPITRSMNDITYDYNHEGGRMLGTKFGYIYQLELTDGNGAPSGDYTATLYNYNDHDGLKPVAIACDLDGTLYFVSLSPDGTENSKLYKFESDDPNLTTPVEVGDLGWPAYGIQTMAFDHNSRRLFWWACDIDGNTMLKEIDKETAAVIDYIPDTPEGDGQQTEMAGMIFEFEYRPYTVTCINEEPNSVLLDADSYDASHVYNLVTSTYYPGKNVDFKVTAPSCQSVDSIVVMKHDNHEEIIAVLFPEDLVNNVGTFAMPACDVDVLAYWVGNEHNITIQVTPSSMQSEITTVPAEVGECGETVTINYGHPVGYMLSRNTLTAKNGSHNNALTINKANYQATFTMPDANVTVKGTYVTIAVAQIDDLCQWQAPEEIPAFTCGNASQNPASSYTLVYKFKKPGASSFVTFTNADMLNGNKFDKAGTWQYYVEVENMYGKFQTATMSFNVLAAPKSIAIEGNQYNCDGDSIVLTVVPTPSTAALTGTFTWTKTKGGVATEVATTTEPKLVINPCATTDAGVYTCVFAPGATTTSDEPATCEVETELGYEVNVATLPNKPIIALQGGGDEICYNSSAILEWDNGVLDPDEYYIEWFIITDTVIDEVADTVWTVIPGANSEQLTTPVLTEETVFGLSIRYQGDYFLCHRESDPDTVRVKEQGVLDVSGNLETCQGFVIPAADCPTVEGEYTDFVWKFDGEIVLEGEAANVLDFENNDELGALLQEAGEHVIDVQAVDATGCTAYGTYDFIIKELPDVIITNNITDDTAHYNDKPVLTITVCAGSIVELTASGADEYRWGDAKDGDDAGEGETTPAGPISTITVIPETTTTYSVSGYSAETGCWNTTTIRINVTPLPEITWINPKPVNLTDTIEISMIEDDILLEATPAGGYFTYAIAGDPDTDYPILDAEGNPTNHFNPSALGIGAYQLIYNIENEIGCSAEEAINIKIVKPYWSDPEYWDPEWYQNCDESREFEISDPHQMGSFIAHVYGLNGVEKTDFEGVTIYITNDIDLQEEPVFYRPFCDTAQFKGTLDGTGKIISNMVILEEDLQMNVMGFIRNLGIKDAKISNPTTNTVIDVVEDARFHNSFITMPTFVNVTPNFEPTGEVRNVYYYGPMDDAKAIGSIYMDNAVEPVIVINPVENTALLEGTGEYDVEGNQIMKGILEEWVWMQNDFNYYTWTIDSQDEELMVNYGWPIFETSFVHHHYIVVAEYEEGSHEFTGTQERTINEGTENEVTYTYAMNGDEVTITFTPDPYVVFDTITIIAHDYRELGVDLDIDYTYANNSFTFTMPLDSIYEPAYWVEIIPLPRRDYWTDEGNYNPTWYADCTEAGQYEITSSEDLAALAWEVDFGGHDFDGVTVYITGNSEIEGCEILDMAGHFWRPIYNFKGTLDFTHYIVENLYIREEVSAMFVDLEGEVRNGGVQNIDLPEEGDVAVYAFNQAEGLNGVVANSFATVNPANLQWFPLVNENVTANNCYTLDTNGNMIDANGNAIDIDALNAWVAAANAGTTASEAPYYDWINDEVCDGDDCYCRKDDGSINYFYPVHNPVHTACFNITYIPSTTDYQADPEAVHGYIYGPTCAPAEDIVTVSFRPDYCYDMTQLWLIDDITGDSTDIKDLKEFEMPENSVTVYAVFTPQEWTLTINYLDVDGETIADPYTALMHYGDEINVNSPVVEGMTPDQEIVQDTMICGNMTIDVIYDGEEHNITFCETMIIDYDEDGEPIFDEWIDYIGYEEVVNYTHETTVTIAPIAGLSIGNVTISEIKSGDEVEYTHEAGTYDYTFTMPMSDVVICAEPTEEYWDDWSIADISWFVGHEDDDTYVLTTDSMLGGLAALVTGREWLYDTSNGHDWLFEGEPYEEGSHFFDFTGKTIIVESEQDDKLIDLIEHKWRPIGAQIEFERWFQGYFDGNGNQIINMTTADMTVLDETGNGSCQAFFGHVGVNAVINDLDIEGIAEGRYFTAGIAGINKGTIINSVSRVKVRSEFEAGGIAGNNYGNIYNTYCAAESIECWSAAPAKGTNNYYVGGIAAYNTGAISNCHNVAELIKGNGDNPINYYGGLVGMNEEGALVENSYWMVNPIEPAIGGGDMTATGCEVLSNTTATVMNTNAQALAAEEGYDLFGWTNGEEGYPVFVREDRTLMDIDNVELNVNVFPNPAKDYVKVTADNNVQRVMVYNMFGQLILNNEVNGEEITVELNNLAAGVYTMRIVTNNGTAIRNIVVK